MEIKGKKILIVEDDLTNILIYQDIILKSDLNAIVEVANNGRDALVKLNDFIPDIIILDIRMPIMDGIEFLEKFRALNGRYKMVKVIVLSSYSSIDQHDKVIKLGAETFIDKLNINQKNLINVIKDNLTRTYNSSYFREP